MSKKHRHRRRRPSSEHRHSRRDTQPEGLRAPDDLDLLVKVRRALATGRPLELLTQVSTILSAVDPRTVDPFDRSSGADDAAATRDNLMASFIDVDRRETSALLAAIAQMSADEVQRARAQNELARRSHSLPAWLSRLEEIDAYRTVEMTHVLPDGDDILIGVRLPNGHELSALVYIDYNMGVLVKDAFVVDEPLDRLLGFMQAKIDDPDTSLEEIDSANARARITEAIDTGAITIPLFESDTWPACRPFVEWITRLLPPGGAGHQYPDWSEEALDDLAERFFASSLGADFDDSDNHDLLDSMLWFGSSYGSCDPLHWSPTRVEILLADWIPRKIVADVDYLSKAPALLRVFIRFCHQQREITPTLTTETLAAVDAWEPEYQQTIRSPRPQGPEALLAAVGTLDPEGPWRDPHELEWHEIMLNSLRRDVGSDEALSSLDERPLPDEAFSWDGIPTDVHERVREVLNACDRYCGETLDIEYRTACRRLLARVAAGDPNIFRRRARPETGAAAVCWIIGKANHAFNPSGLLVKDLMASFGLKGSVSQRARTMLRAGGFDPDQYGGMALGAPDYLVSSRRQRMIALRDRYRAMGEA